MLRWARWQGVESALHTCGRRLNQHPPIHLSVTRGRPDIKHGIWKNIFFKKHPVEEIWRGAVIRLLRHSYDLINPASLLELGHIRDICRRSTGASGKYPWRMAERQIPRALPEATTGVGGEAQALQRRRGGVLLLRPPHSSVFIIHKVAADKDLLWNVMNRDKKEELKLFCGMYFIHFQVISVIRLRISVKKRDGGHCGP